MKEDMIGASQDVHVVRGIDLDREVEVLKRAV